MKRSTWKHLRSSAAAILLTLAATQAFAARPFLADDADTSKPGKGVLELKGIVLAEEHANIRRSANEFEGKLAVGLCKNLEAALVVGGVANERVKEDDVLKETQNGFTDMALEIKYKVVDADGVKLTVKPTLLLPTGTRSNDLRKFSDGRLGYGAALLASKSVGHFTLLANASYLFHDYRDATMHDERVASVWSGAIGTEYEPIHNLKLVADLGMSSNPEKSAGVTNNELKTYLLVGAEYEIGHHLAIFTAGKFGLTRVSDDVAALYGLSVKF